jgi:hypothetical protein
MKNNLFILKSIFIVLVLFPCFAQGQSDKADSSVNVIEKNKLNGIEKKAAVSFSLMGINPFVGISLEQLITNKLIGEFGVGFPGVFGLGFKAIPKGVQENKVLFHWGASITYIYEWGPNAYIPLGMTYYKKDVKYSIDAGIAYGAGENGLTPWAGIKIGKRFNNILAPREKPNEDSNYIFNPDRKNDEAKLKKNAIYIDAGTILFTSQGSINYERQFYSGEQVSLYARVGYGAAAVAFGPEGYGGIGAITLLTGKKENHFEVNGGMFVGEESYDQSIFILPLLDLGYRYQKPQGGFIFRAKAGALGIGIGLGYAF